MENFEFYVPTIVVFGRGTQSRVGELVKEFGGARVLIHFGGGSAIRSGLLKEVEESLDKSGIKYVELVGVVPNPLLSKVREGISLCRKEKLDFILAVGGGSVIDSSKAIAYGLANDCDVWDLYCGKCKARGAAPVGAVLTIAAAGSETSEASVITNDDGMLKRGYSSDFGHCKFAVMNPELTYTLPSFQTACGIVDMMAHIMERYFSNTSGVEITDRLCEGTLKAIMKEAAVVMQKPNDYDARANLMWSGTIAHNGICGVGREEDWASHFMEHEVSAVYDVSHGAGLAVIFPAWLTFMAEHHVEKVYQFAVRVMAIPAGKDRKAVALEGIDRLKNFYTSIGMPVNFGELGIENPDIDLLVKKLHANKGEQVGCYFKLISEYSREIYEIACR